MDPTTLNTIVTILGILVGCAALYGLCIERSKRQIALIEAIGKTLSGIQRGRGCKVAVIEDFAIHKSLILALVPYMPLKRYRLKKALDDYEQWHNTIKASGTIGMFGAGHESEFHETVCHLMALKCIVQKST